jgi:acyl-coenzyme A thioesterase PaaI-like protein
MWRRTHSFPGGSWLFSRLFGIMVPYSGSIAPHVRRLEPGRATVTMTERRRLRNHLQSVHALALANLGELASGLAMVTGFGPGVRGIPVRITSEYSKKARGRLVADSSCPPHPHVAAAIDAQASATIRDDSGDIVATVTVDWRLDETPR